jgi:hypothetical protein
VNADWPVIFSIGFLLAHFSEGSEKKFQSAVRLMLEGGLNALVLTVIYTALVKRVAVPGEPPLWPLFIPGAYLLARGVIASPAIPLSMVLCVAIHAAELDYIGRLTRLFFVSTSALLFAALLLRLFEKLSLSRMPERLRGLPAQMLTAALAALALSGPIQYWLGGRP